MKTFRHLLVPLLALAIGSSPAAAQLSLEMRVSAVEAEDFLPRDVAYSGDLVWDFNEILSLYGGYNWAEFTYRDGSPEHYQSSGFQAGAKVTLLRGSSFQPWVRGGVVRNSLRYQIPSQDFDEESDATFGTQFAAGVDIPILSAITLSAGVHRQQFPVEINEDECDGSFGLVPSFCTDFTTWGLDLGVRLRLLN